MTVKFSQCYTDVTKVTAHPRAVSQKKYVNYHE